MSHLILVVDDDDTTRHMLRLILQFAGYEVIEATDGLKALAQVAAHQPDALILDVMMPNMDGLTVCRTLRAQPETADLCIIILSAVAEEESVGANLYLRKPMNPNDLIAHLEELLPHSAESD